MAKNYERVDFTYLLDELQGNTVLAPVDEEPINHMEIKKIKVQEAKGDMAIYEDSLIVVSEMIQHVIKPYDMYLPHVETILILFKELEGRTVPNYKIIEKKLGLFDKKERSRIITWLNNIKTAIEQGNDYDVEFFSDRLCTKTGFCDYVQKFVEIDPNEIVIDAVPEPKAESLKLHRMLSDEKVKYIYSGVTLKIHDKSCPRVRMMDDDEINSSSEYMVGYVPCPECEIKSYIRAGAKDIKEYDTYTKLFEIMGADKDTIKRMYVDLKFKTQISHMHTEGYKYSNLTNNAITIWYREDTWRIGVTDKKHVRLEHNNYKKKKGGEREFVPGFHIQSDRTHSASLNYVLGVIRDYRYSSHLAMPAAKANNAALNIPKAHEYIPKNPNEFIYEETVIKKSVKERILGFLRRTLLKDRLYKTRHYTEENRPNNNELCLYLWVDEKGDKHWSSGRYLHDKKQFSVSYEGQKIITSIDKVIKWVPLDEINAG